MCYTVRTNDGQEIDDRAALARWLGLASHTDLPDALGYANLTPRIGLDCLCTVDLASISRITPDGCGDYQEAPNAD